MCTVVILIRPGHTWPIALGANRDEQRDRAWDPPDAWWPDCPDVVAGRDRSGGGTWLGVNRSGVVAAVLNRPGSLGPAPGKRTRGELPLIALDHASANDAVASITNLTASDWRSFNMVVADRAGAVFIRGLGRGRPEAQALAPGLHLVTAHDPDDPDSPRVARHLDRFRTARAPDTDQWQSWTVILADRAGSAAEQINVAPRAGFGTICSSLIALPATGAPIWLFAAGPPDVAPFVPVDLESFL
ncbi:MAG TPA: NRDE family protein [Acetobacteraceae bacterium]|nr:NRDE family protein [Acetobacteraceae bacterium]